MATFIGEYDYTKIDPEGWIIYPAKSIDPSLSNFDDTMDIGLDLCRQTYDEEGYYNQLGYCCQALYQNSNSFSEEETVISFIVDSYNTEAQSPLDMGSYMVDFSALKLSGAKEILTGLMGLLISSIYMI